ncbi:MAG: 6-phosphofructokinase [Planctomycetota bacterium]|jgi:6-phosphofructokinase 1
MSDLRGNAVFAQSGGPTAAINSSIAGAVQEAMEHDCFEDLYGAYNGILGVLGEDLFDMRRERADDIENLKRTPSAALGSCRYKVRKSVDLERIVDVFKAHNVRYFFYAGGNDSMDTADKVAALAGEGGWEMRVMGIPKTIDNDLAHTDHTPGDGSVVQYNATAAMEAGRDTEALWTHDTCTVMEIMGRNAGWIAAGTGLARREAEDAPHLIYLPERPVSLERIADDVRACLKEHRCCFIAAGEGAKNEKGEYLASMGGAFGQDDFGHVQLGGVADFLRAFIEKEVGVKVRTNKMGTAQRNAMHFASLTDVTEAAECGAAAVRKAVAGQSGFMITLVRESGPVYRCGTGTALLADVANGEKLVPDEFINEAGNGITEAMREYVKPLVRGEAPVNIGPDGLPIYVRLQKRFVPKQLAQWSAED